MESLPENSRSNVGLDLFCHRLCFLAKIRPTPPKWCSEAFFPSMYSRGKSTYFLLSSGYCDIDWFTSAQKITSGSGELFILVYSIAGCTLNDDGCVKQWRWCFLYLLVSFSLLFSKQYCWSIVKYLLKTCREFVVKYNNCICGRTINVLHKLNWIVGRIIGSKETLL